MASPSKHVDVQLTDEEYARLRSLAEKRDCSVQDLVRQAIRQVYMNDLEADLSVEEVRRLGQRSLLAAEDGEEIGIGGPRILAEGEGAPSD
jgi:predicted transcriptional regulator